MPRRSLLQDDDLIDLLEPGRSPEQTRPIYATEDQQLIREWAAQHAAEPATGEATASGPATVNVQDGGAGIRFNFPAAAPFRPITWEEWFEHFTTHNLIFVYEGDVPGQPPGARFRLLPRQRLQKRR